MAHDFGCPNTEMHTNKVAFEKYVKRNKLKLNLKMHNNAPHYSSHNTRVEFYKFSMLPVKKWYQFWR